MKQLFICHTQYNLTLAIGVSTENDDLILFRDFDLKEDIRQKLELQFKKVLFLDGNYPKKECTAKEKLNRISDDNHKIKAFIIETYDRLFIVDDMCIQEMYAMKCAYQHNRNVEMAWLEDGANAYFSNGVVSGGMGATPLKRAIRKCFFTLRYGLFGFYDLAACMGGHKRLKTAYVTFPDSIRKELKGKKLITITDHQFKEGMKFIYAGQETHFEPDSLLFALDKLDVYGDKFEKVNELIKELIYNSPQTIYYKYHPRETNQLPALSESIELDRDKALESYLANSDTKELTVVGIKSTALQTAKKMGYNTISLINQIEKNDAVVQFYRSIGVECR